MLSSGNFQKLLEPRFRKVFFDTYDEVPEQFSEIFQVKSSKKAKEHDYHVSGTGMWDEKNPGDEIGEEGIDAGQEITYTHKSYAKKITIEREFADDELYGVLDKLPRKLGEGGRVTVEMTAANVLNNSFTVNGYDNVPLFSNSHPNLHSDSFGDNLMTGAALADSTLKLGLLQMRKNTITQEGLKMSAKTSDIVIPADLEYITMTLMQSMGLVGSPNNDKNVLPKLRPVVLDYLTSTTAWFLMDRRLNQLTFFWRVKPEFKSAENFDNMVAKYRGYLRFGVGYSDHRGWIGNPGV